MVIFLSVLAILAAVAGGLAFSSAQSALHEVEGLIAFLIFTVAVGSACIVASIGSLREAIGTLAAQANAKICDGCDATYTGGGAVVRVEGQQKRVCPSCAQALIEDAKGAAGA